MSALQQSSKRKRGNADNSQQPPKRFKTVRDARTIRAQPSDAAYSNGELDVASFVQAREFEIRALEESLRKTRNAPTTRAFQQVPRELRRRTASHNVKKVPKRLRRRAAREMVEDNTPTVDAKSRRKEAGSKMRLRIDTARRLQRLTQKVKANKAKRAEKALAVSVSKDEPIVKPALKGLTQTSIKTRLPRIKKNALQKPTQPPAKFAKRQRNKTWLPTHLYHTKRAHMTPSRSPLWGWAIPLSPTMKGYRATHRASSEKGALAWDMSYISTISLAGRIASVEGLLRALGVGSGRTEAETWGKRGQKWRSGKRVWHGWMHERQKWPQGAIAPVTVIWEPETAPIISEPRTSSGQDPQAPQQHQGQKTKRRLFLRVHPSAFTQIWYAVLSLSKVQKPAVMVEDLRFEIGSIEVQGPQALEALAGDLKEYVEQPKGLSTKTWNPNASSQWQKLCCCTNSSSLPKGFVIPLQLVDPRQSFPPRKIAQDRLTSTAAQQSLLELATEWPWDRQVPSPARIFDRLTRLTATNLPTQKSIDRRKRAALLGKSAGEQPAGPYIPALVYATPTGGSGATTLTVLLPWKCLVLFWRALMFYPLSTGGQVALACLEQRRQVCFERGVPWFPGDFPGTKAGDAWSRLEAEKQQAAWERTPKAKRVSFDSLQLGLGQKGELGRGWCCDWDFLKELHAPDMLMHLSRSVACSYLSQYLDAAQAEKGAVIGHEGSDMQETIGKAGLAIVRLTLLSKGAPKTNARIYRLPSSSEQVALRKDWLALQPQHNHRKPKGLVVPATAARAIAPDAPIHVRNQHLAASLLQPHHSDNGKAAHPSVPDKTDLLGFVTNGNYNLAHGLGTGVGSILLGRALDGPRGSGKVDERLLCIVRNAGEVTGRLARWELV